MTMYNGNGFTISNFSYSSATTNDVGLFAAVGGNAIIENLTLQNPVVSGKSYVGPLIGIDDGLSGITVSNVQVIGAGASVTATTQYAGGLAGRFSGLIQSSSSSANILGTGTAYYGGLVGAVDGANSTISNSFSTGTLSGPHAYSGGLVGQVSVSGILVISNSYRFGAVSGTTQTYVGGLIGWTLAGGLSITNSYSSGNVTAIDNAGGLVGAVLGAGPNTIINSFYTGTVTTTTFNAGGIVGQMNGPSQIIGCFSSGDILANTGSGGGLVGVLNTNAGYGIYNSYSSSIVNGAVPSKLGGLIGNISGGSPDVQYSYATGIVQVTATSGGITGKDTGTGTYVAVYFDSTINTTINGVGSGSGSQTAQNNVNVFGDSTALMKTPATFTGAGWLTSIWTLVSGSYPSLAWQ